jgi:hypothetical protein
MTRVRARSAVAVAAAWLLGLLLVPAAASALAGAKATASFPGAVTVGETGLGGSIALENRNTPLEAEDTNTVCNAAELLAPCLAPQRGIVLVPSCRQLSGDVCVGPDPGVFAFSPTAVGKTGSACAGMAFNVAVIDPTFGTVRFTPQPAGAHVMLPGVESRCEIGFAFRVLKAPAGDALPNASGVQTVQATEHRQYVGLVGPAAPTVVARASTTGTTVVTPPPPPPAPIPDFALFTSSPKTLRVSKAGRFTYSLFATPGRKGKARLTSTKSIKLGSKRRKLKVAAKSFKVPSDAKVKVKFRLSPTSLRALKKRTSLTFKVDVTVGGEKFSAKLKLKPPKKS